MKRYRFLIAFLLLLLAACGAAEIEPTESVAELTPVATEAVVNEDVPTPTATDQVEPETESETTEEVSEPTAVPALEVAFPATNFAEAALIRDSDYFKGAEEPVVEIIEYGDFQ